MEEESGGRAWNTGRRHEHKHLKGKKEGAWGWKRDTAMEQAGQQRQKNEEREREREEDKFRRS